MAATIAVTFDQPAYSPGTPIIMTIAVTGIDDPAPRTITIRGDVVIDGQPVAFTGDLVLDAPAPTVIGVRLTDTGGFDWQVYTPPTPLPPNTYQFTAFA